MLFDRVYPRIARVVSLCALAGGVAILQGVPAHGQTPTCQIRIDDQVLRAGTFQVAYTGTDAGVNNSGIRLTSMGHATRNGASYTIWRVRNSKSSARTLTLAATDAWMQFRAAPHSELYVRSEIVTGTAQHSVSYTSVTGNVTTIDSQPALSTAWNDATLIADPLCAQSTTKWLAQSQGLYRLGPGGGSVLLEVPIAGGADVVTTDAPFSNAWVYTDGKLRAFAPDGLPLVDVITVQRPAGVSPRLAVDGTGANAWLALGSILYRLNYDGSVAGQITLPGTARALQFDPSRSLLWASTFAGFSIVRGGLAGEPAIVSIVDVPVSPGGAYGLALDSLHDGAWVASSTALSRYDSLGQIQMQTPTSFAPINALAVDGSGGVWGISADRVAHFGSNGAKEWELNGIGSPDGGVGAISIASDPLAHEAWVISPSDIRAVPVQQVLSLVPAPLPSPGVATARTVRQLEFFVDRAGPVLQFSAPAANSYTNNRRPTLQVSYADQSSSVNTQTLQFKLGSAALAVTCSSVTATAATCVAQQDLPEGAIDISATVNDQDGNPSVPMHRYFTVDVTPPVISVTTPVNGGYTNQAQGPIEGYLIEPGTLTIGGTPAIVDALNHFSAAVTFAEGPNTRVLAAADRAGNQSTLNFSVTLDTQPPAIPDIAQLSLSAVANGSVTVTGAAGSVEAGVVVRVTNLRTNAVATGTAGASGDFTIALAADAGDAIRVEALDAAGNISPAAQVAVAGGGGTSQLSIVVSEPLAGLVTGERFVLVRGTVSGDEAATVAISSIVAATTAQGGMVTFSALVPLNPGANTLDIRAATTAGLTAQASRVVTRTGDAPFAVTAEPASGLAPLTVRFEVRQYTDVPFAQAEFDYDGDGTFDETLMAPQAAIEYVYQTAGELTAQIRVQDYSSRTFLFKVPVSVGSQARTDALVRRAWTDLVGALSAGDRTAALLQVADGSRDHFSAVFAALEGTLPQIAASFESIQPFLVSGSYAQYVLVRNVNGVQSAYLVEFIRDYDGLWRLSAL